MDRKYPPGDSDILLQLQNLRGCQSSAFVDFTLQASQNGEVLEGTYPEASDDAVDNYMSTIDPGKTVTGLGIAGVCIVVVDHQTGISAVVLGNRKLFETDGEFVSCNINGCTCTLSRGRAAWGGRILCSGRTAICAVIRKLG